MQRGRISDSLDSIFTVECTIWKIWRLHIKPFTFNFPIPSYLVPIVKRCPFCCPKLKSQFLPLPFHRPNTPFPQTPPLTNKAIRLSEPPARVSDRGYKSVRVCQPPTPGPRVGAGVHVPSPGGLPTYGPIQPPPGLRFWPCHPDPMAGHLCGNNTLISTHARGFDSVTVAELAPLFMQPQRNLRLFYEDWSFWEGRRPLAFQSPATTTRQVFCRLGEGLWHCVAVMINLWTCPFFAGLRDSYRPSCNLRK